MNDRQAQILARILEPRDARGFKIKDLTHLIQFVDDLYEMIREQQKVIEHYEAITGMKVTDVIEHKKRGL